MSRVFADISAIADTSANADIVFANSEKIRYSLDLDDTQLIYGRRSEQ